MKDDPTVEIFYDTVINEKLFSNKGNLKFHLNSLFEGIEFANKRVLDIGGGNGICSYYASCKGAKEAICLEPSAEGSSVNTIRDFKRLGKLLNSNNVSIEPITFQKYNPDNKGFDIILLNNSINHLDEIACINLHNDQRSKATYKGIISDISAITNNGAIIIICDCSRYNLFNMLNVRNPFAPTIEWNKHQSPKVWLELFKDVGFINPRIRWSSFNRLRYWGKLLTGNKLMAYFLHSHFCLTMEKL